MVLFGGLVLILTHAKVITLLIENSIEGLQLICSGSGPESRGIILWFEHRGRNSSCTSWVWYWLHLFLPLKLGLLRNLSCRSFESLDCFMFIFQDTSKTSIHKWIFTMDIKKKKKKSGYLATSAAVVMAQVAVAVEALVLGQPVWLLWGGSPASSFNETCITVWDVLRHHIFHGCSPSTLSCLYLQYPQALF